MLPERRLKQIVRLISLSLISQILISLPVWVSSFREFPTAPVIQNLEYGIAGKILFFLLLSALSYLLFKPLNRWVIGCATGIFFLLVVEDQSRLQPWVFLYSLMLLGMVFYPKDKRVQHSLKGILLLLSLSYFWSGVQKMNYFFGHELFPWLAEFTGQKAWLDQHPEVGYWIGGTEAIAGLALLFRPGRKVGALIILGIHLFILISLGPFGHNWNQVVWPWNICFALILVLLVWSPDEISKTAGVRSFPPSPYGLFCLIVVGFLPVWGIFGKWDHFLSGGFYSSVVPDSIFYYHEEDRNKLPESSKDFQLFHPGTEEEFVLLDQWALDHLKVPTYPEIRVKLNIGNQLCDCVSNPQSAGLRIHLRDRWSGTSETWEIPCLEMDDKKSKISP